MNEKTAKLIAGVAGIGAVILSALIAAQMVDQENVLIRIFPGFCESGHAEFALNCYSRRIGIE